ncbi:uncharacterized protein LOC135475736 isoform X2 [Liolophura sinensis]|uniref:uncharacterized protein LOC135475736 isoform X2 n=1 Tax=Liolophura sinensis TaxID=3198878 RepID=UPI0031590F7F
MSAYTIEMETTAIIGIGVAAGVVFLASVMILVYCLCLKNRSRDKEQKSPRNSSGSTFIPNDGMPSTLPKVGSNGLWIPSQSMLSASPSSAYTQAKPQSKPPRDILYRAASEPRMLDGHDPGRGYQGNLRIYHSQQLAPLYEVYEPGRYDRYLGMFPSSDGLCEDGRMYHSQAMLIENGFQMNNVYEKEVDDGRPRVRRSASDLTSPGQKHKQRPRSNDERGMPYVDKTFKAVVEVHQHRQLPVRSYWGANRGPNKERLGGPRGKSAAKDGAEYVQDNTLTRQSQIPVDQLQPGSSRTWDPSLGYHTTDSTTSTTIYSPDTGEPYTVGCRQAYSDPTEENFKLELTAYSSQSSKPASVDQGVQVGPETPDMARASADNTVSSKHTDVEEDGGYFTSSGRTDLTYSKEDRFSIPKPVPDHDGASDVTDLASKGKHVTAEAFQFLDTYLSDDEHSVAVG